MQVSLTPRERYPALFRSRASNHRQECKMTVLSLHTYLLITATFPVATLPSSEYALTKYTPEATY